jgi:hypothetical protein
MFIQSIQINGPTCVKVEVAMLCVTSRYDRNTNKEYLV